MYCPVTSTLERIVRQHYTFFSFSLFIYIPPYCAAALRFAKSFLVSLLRSRISLLNRFSSLGLFLRKLIIFAACCMFFILAALSSACRWSWSHPKLWSGSRVYRLHYAATSHAGNNSTYHNNLRHRFYKTCSNSYAAFTAPPFSTSRNSFYSSILHFYVQTFLWS